MNNSQQKALLDEFNDEVWHKANVDAVDDFCTNKIITSSPFGKSIGITELKASIAEWSSYFPDLAYKETDVISANDTTVIKWVCNGTHQKRFMVLEPTGNRAHYDGVCILYFNNNKITDYYSNTNLFSILQQLGANETSQLIPLTRRQNIDILLNELKKLKQNEDQAPLTDREVEVLSFYLNGKTAKHIANILGLSHRTVQTHIHNSMLKLNCSTKSDLFDMANASDMINLFNDFYRLVLKHD